MKDFQQSNSKCLSEQEKRINERQDAVLRGLLTKQNEHFKKQVQSTVKYTQATAVKLDQMIKKQTDEKLAELKEELDFKLAELQAKLSSIENNINFNSIQNELPKSGSEAAPANRELQYVNMKKQLT